MFQKAFTMFAPFARREGQPDTAAPEAGKPPRGPGEIDDLKKQMDEMQKRRS